MGDGDQAEEGAEDLLNSSVSRGEEGLEGLGAGTRRGAGHLDQDAPQTERAKALSTLESLSDLYTDRRHVGAWAVLGIHSLLQSVGPVRSQLEHEA